MDKTNKQSFVQGAFILMVASLIIKGIGAVYKIPIINLIGEEGNGIFTIAYYIYTFMFIVSTAGLPVAVSKMVAEANALGRPLEVRRIARTALFTFLGVGAFFTLVVWLGVDMFTYFTVSAAKYAILAIAPAIFFTCVISAIRGYFQGMSNMVPTAISQIIEALGKLAFGLVLAIWLDRQGYGLEVVVAGAIGGVTLGTLVSAIYVALCYVWDSRRRRREEPVTQDISEVPSRSVILKRLIKLAIPVTIGASVLSLTNLMDTFVVLGRLQEGCLMTEPEASALYGVYNMAVTLFNIPPALVSGIAISIIPAIAAALALSNRERSVRLTETAFRFTALLTLPCAFGMAMVARPALGLVYYNLPDSVETATPLLWLLCPAMFFVSTATMTNAILQAIGRERAPVKSMLIGGLVKLSTNYILVGIPAINMHGAPIGTTLCYAVITVINVWMIRRAGLKFSLGRALMKPLIAAGAMGLFTWLIGKPLYAMLGQKLGVVVVVGLSALFYLLMLIATKALPKEDILMLPKGEKIAKILRIH